MIRVPRQFWRAKHPVQPVGQFHLAGRIETNQLAATKHCFYNCRVLDIKLIREKTDFVRQRLATRGAGDESSSLTNSSSSTSSGGKFSPKSKRSKAQRNRVSKEIGALMGQKKIAEAEAKKAETRDLGDKIAALDKQAAESEAKRDALMLQLPNLPHESVPLGKSAEDNPDSPRSR